MNNKLPPYNEDAERSVLSEIMIDPSIVFGVMTELEANDFYSTQRKHIYGAITDLAIDSKPIDMLTIAQRMRDKKVFEEAGGIVELAHCENHTPTASVVNHHSGLVKGLSVRRQAIRYLDNSLREAYEKKSDTVELLQEVYEKAFHLNMKLDGRGDKKDVYTPSEIADLAVENIEYKVQNPGAITGVKTGYDLFDEVTGGIQPVTVIAGATGTGKTALCLNLACRIGILEKVPTLYINFEMTMKSVINRILATMSGVTLREIKTGVYQDVESIRRVTDFADQLEEGNLSITDNTPKSLARTLSLIQKHYVQDKIKLVFIDYIGEIEPTKDEQQRGTYHSHGDYVQSIKDMCNLYGIRCVFAAQLNPRKAAEGDAKKENVSDSAKIIMKSDVFVSFGFEKVVDFSGDDPAEKVVHYMLIDKNRDGKQLVKIYMDYNKDCQQISEIGYSLPDGCEKSKPAESKRGNL